MCIRDRFRGSEDIVWTNVWPWHSNPTFHKTLWLLITYHQTMFVSKRVGRYSRNCHILVIWALAVTLTLKIINQSFYLDLENNKPIFSHDTPAHDGASPNQVWIQNVRRFRRYHPDEHSLTFWTNAMTMIFNGVILFIFHNALLLMMMYHQTKFGCQRISASEDTIDKVMLIIWALTVTLTSKIASVYFCKTLRLMTL